VGDVPDGGRAAHPVGLKDLIQGMCPPYKTMADAVDAVVALKYGPARRLRGPRLFPPHLQRRTAATATSRKFPTTTRVSSSASRTSAPTSTRRTAASPAHVDAIYVPGVWIQVHHLDLEYYEQAVQQRLHRNASTTPGILARQGRARPAADEARPALPSQELDHDSDQPEPRPIGRRSRPRAARDVLRLLAVLAILAGAAVLLLTAYALDREATWLPPPSAPPGETEDQRNERAFLPRDHRHEIVPLPVLQVLPEICAGGSPLGTGPIPAAGTGGGRLGRAIRILTVRPGARAPGRAGQGPAAGVHTVSHYRPKSGAPLAGRVRRPGLRRLPYRAHQRQGRGRDGQTRRLNLFAWIDDLPGGAGGGTSG